MKKKVRICYYNDWADGLYGYDNYKNNYLSGIEGKMSDPDDPDLLIKGFRKHLLGSEAFLFGKVSGSGYYYLIPGDPDC